MISIPSYVCPLSIHINDEEISAMSGDMEKSPLHLPQVRMLPERIVPSWRPQVAPRRGDARPPTRRRGRAACGD